MLKTENSLISLFNTNKLISKIIVLIDKYINKNNEESCNDI